MHIEEDRYYRPKDPELREIAAEQTLAVWRHKGRGPAYITSGSRILYKGADLLAWLDANRVQTSKESKMRSHLAIEKVTPPATRLRHETTDDYLGVIARLCDRHRVIVGRDAIQWTVQHRKNGGAERPWRAVGCFRTRDALIRFCASLCGRVDPAAMAALVALPSHFGGAA